MSIKTIVEAYYGGIARGDDWQSFIADDVTFSRPGSITKGKDAYIKATSGFLRLVEGSNVKELIVEGNKAFALVHYDLLSPKGNSDSSDVAELLAAMGGKIAVLTIVFDTAAFSEFMARG